MEFFTLDTTFQRDSVIDEFTSAIWTERFTKNGDVELVLPDTTDHRTALAPGRFLELQGSDEPMIIETRSTESGLLTVKGRTIETFFDEREVWTSSDPDVTTWDLRDHPGTIIGQVVHDMVIASTYLSSSGLGIGALLNRIQNLVLGDIDVSDPIVSIKVPFGPMYETILNIAETYRLGMKIALNVLSPLSYELIFSVYKGVNRTSDQLENDLVRFSGEDDSMTNIKTLASISGYKTVVYLFPPSWSSATAPTVEYAPGTDPAATDFDRRVLIAQASDISEDEVTGGVTLASLMTQRAKDALANANLISMIDGEVTQQSQYKYGEHYKLGDTVELSPIPGVHQKAMITEFIRSQDAAGEKAYPTVSVVN